MAMSNSFDSIFIPPGYERGSIVLVIDMALWGIRLVIILLLLAGVLIVLCSRGMDFSSISGRL